MSALLAGSSVVGANTVTDFSTDGTISFDLDLVDPHHPLRLDFELSAADAGATIDFDAIVRNFSGDGLSRLFVSLSVAGFDTIGTVTRSFGGSGRGVDLFIGDPLGTPGAADWRIDTGALQAGDLLSITIGVPEPDSRALLLAALLALGWTARARRQR